MKTYDPDIEDQLDAGRIDRRDAVLFLLDEGAFGFFAGGPGTIPWNTVPYVGAGGLIDIKAGELDLSQTQNPIEVTLASKYEVDGEVVELISSETLQSIEDYSYYRRPAIVGRFYIAPTGQVIDFVQLARCEIQTVVHNEDDSKGYSITANLNSLGAFRKLVDAKTRNKELQALIDPTDRGLDGIGTVVTEKVYWGGMPPTVQP